MSLTKQYLRYAPSGVFNIVASGECNSCHVTLKGVIGRYIAVGACEHVFIWDMKLGEKAQVLPGEKVVVTQIAASPSGNHMAVGYADGNINIFELMNNEVVCVFAGHKSAITCLQYDEIGHRLVSGAKDTEVILWDVIAETGIARFSGHKNAITSVQFMNSKNCIISSSKDSFLKFWDIETKHCFKTLGGHQAEVWSAVLMKDEKYLVTGSKDDQLKVFKLYWATDVKEEHKSDCPIEIVKLDEADKFTDGSTLQCHQVGSLERGGSGRVAGLAADPEQRVLASFGKDDLLELFLFCSDEDAKLRMKKRIAKKKKKLQKKLNSEEEDTETSEIPETLTLSDEVRKMTTMKLTGRIKSVTIQGSPIELRVGVTLANNTVECYSVDMGAEKTVKCLKKITMPGHQKEPRCVAISSDNFEIISASSDSIKVWNRASQSCLRTISVPRNSLCRCICYAPGDRHALVGNADGKLYIVDTSAGRVLEEVEAHSEMCNSVGLTPDMRGCFTGGGDKTVKLWQFELIEDPTGESKAKVLSVLHTRTLELEESVVAVKISPNNKFIAVALMDSTVKIFFMDTFKFYLSLYGHKLPVKCLDISYDSTLIVTGSADRNVKIWGMDFGDCHKSIFAHNDSVTALQFVPSTHYFFTVSKDGKVKEWDADNYENIITLQGHAGECWDLSVGAGGLHAVTCGSDGAMRMYARTEEPLVLGDDEEEEEQLATGEEHPSVPGCPNLNLASKKTIGAEKGADSIMECLSVSGEYKKELQEAQGKPVQPPLLMVAYNCSTPEDFLVETIKRIRSTDLEQSLLLLPFSAACELIKLLPSLLDRSDNVELLVRVACFMVKVHHKSLVANKLLLKELIQIQAKGSLRINELRDIVGDNIAGFQWAKRNEEEKEMEQSFLELNKRKDKRRRVRPLKRPLVTVT